MGTEPVSPGYALPDIAATPSPAASAVRTAAIAANPSSYEILTKPRAVVDQQDLPCCVSTALAGAMEILNPSWPPLSPLFHYYVTRYNKMEADSRGFLELESGLGTLTNEGICIQKFHAPPYTTEGAATPPEKTAYDDAAKRALGRRRLRPRYEEVEGPSKVAWIRQQLRQDSPVVLGIQLPSRYPGSFLEPGYIWRDPNQSLSLSGHCVLAFGYDDSRLALHIQDSRGPGAFERGCWWLGYRVVDNSPVVMTVYKLIP